MMGESEKLELSKYFKDSELVQKSQPIAMIEESGVRPSRKRKAKEKHDVQDKFSGGKTANCESGKNSKGGIIFALYGSLKLKEVDFNKSGANLAQFLLGKVLTRVCDNGDIISGRIVETEAYIGEIDQACHTYGGKRTERTQAMYMAPGTLYVYLIYGMYHCLNISSTDVGGCVLIRAIEPIQGKDHMRKLRYAKSKSGKQKLKDNALCNGPSKLCVAFAITKESLNKEYLVSSEKLWIEVDGNSNDELNIVVTKRIGIDSYGQEWAAKPLRFYVLGNSCISVRDRKAEENLLSDCNQCN